MGGDGGVIAVQREFVRGTYHSSHKKKLAGWGANYGAGTTGGDAEKGVDPRRVRAVKVRTCALSGSPLEAPIVADELGHLFNKIDVLSALSERTLPDHLAHIRGLRDLIDCRLSPAATSKDDKYHTGESGAISVCPVTGQPLDGSQPFVVAKTTGWVLSRKAVDALGIDSLQNEYGPLTLDDLIRIAPDEEEYGVLREKMLERRANQKKTSKKKRKKEAVEDEAQKPVVVTSQAARIAQQAANQAQGDRDKNSTIGGLFHGKTKPADASKLFIATAPRRYYLN